MTPYPKPVKRWRASTKQWARIREQFRGKPCQVCGGKWNSLHHIVPRSQSGCDVAANLAPLCMTCHDEIHARNNQIRGKLAASLTHVQRVYILNRKGAGWLEAQYPEWRDAA